MFVEKLNSKFDSKFNNKFGTGDTLFDVSAIREHFGEFFDINLWYFTVLSVWGEQNYYFSIFVFYA